jgi:hypothetical protein
MSIILFATNVYFGMLLGVAELTKIRWPDAFQSELLAQRGVPKWSAYYIAIVFPWLEIIVAAFLVMGAFLIPTAVVTLILFTVFLVFKIVLYKNKRLSGCACFVANRQETIDLASITTSILFFLLALFQLWASIQIQPLNGQLQLLIGTVFLITATWILFKGNIMSRIAHLRISKM